MRRVVRGCYRRCFKQPYFGKMVEVFDNNNLNGLVVFSNMFVEFSALIGEDAQVD